MDVLLLMLMLNADADGMVQSSPSFMRVSSQHMQAPVCSVAVPTCPGTQGKVPRNLGR